MPAEFSHHYANLDGVRIHYVTTGQGAPVVLLHGWPQTWYEWRRAMPLLADKYSLVAPDIRGLGDSTDCGHFIPEEKPAELANRLREFLAQ